MKKIIFAIIAAFTLGACDQVSQKLGLEDSAKKEARLEPEAKAVGSACLRPLKALVKK